MVPESEKQLDQLVRGDVDVRKTVLLQEAPPSLGEAAKEWRIDWVLYEPNRLILDALSDGSGILFLSEIDYPGWKATLDGKKTKILRANTLFRSVVLPPGTHRLEMRYDPLSFKAGCLVSGSTLLFLIPLLFFL